MRVTLEKGAYLPKRQHATDAGLDLYSPVAVAIAPYSKRVIDTGVHVEIPTGCCGLLVSKSGLNCNHDITTTGLIDEGYTGTIRVAMYNHSDKPYYVEIDDKISQLVIIPCIYPSVELADHFAGGDRGDAGFGSTGR